MLSVCSMRWSDLARSRWTLGLGIASLLLGVLAIRDDVLSWLEWVMSSPYLSGALVGGGMVLVLQYAVVRISAHRESRKAEGWDYGIDWWDDVLFMWKMILFLLLGLLPLFAILFVLLTMGIIE